MKTLAVLLVPRGDVRWSWIKNREEGGVGHSRGGEEFPGDELLPGSTPEPLPHVRQESVQNVAVEITVPETAAGLKTLNPPESKGLNRFFQSYHSFKLDSIKGIKKD